MDKRRCRQLHRDDFIAAIAQYRATQSDSTALMHEASDASAPALVRRGPSMSGGLGSVRGWVRKRPLLPHEEAKGEYDAVSVARKDLHRASDSSTASLGIRSVGSNITTHCCLLKPDLRRMFIRHSTFSPNGGVLDESASSDDCFAAFGVDLVELALRGGRGTLLMYGQTGSGKTMTISHMQGRAAHHLFGGVTKDRSGSLPLLSRLLPLRLLVAIAVTCIQAPRAPYCRPKPEGRSSRARCLMWQLLALSSLPTWRLSSSRGVRRRRQ